MNKYIVETVYQDSDHELATRVEVEDEAEVFIIVYDIFGGVENYWKASGFFYATEIEEFYVDGDPL